MSQIDSLSVREIQIVLSIGTGATYPEIGLKLNIALESVRSYVNRVRNKLEIRRKSALAIWASQNTTALQTRLQTLDCPRCNEKKKKTKIKRAVTDKSKQ